MLRFGLVGCGGISEAHGKASQGLDSFAFVAAADNRLENAQSWSERFGPVPVYDDYIAMVKAQQLDGVLLATWPSQHREQIEELIAAGVRVIVCEKALALDSQDAIGIYESARASGTRVIEAYMYRYHPSMVETVARVRAGAVGTIDYITANFNAFDPEDSDGKDANRNWRQIKELGGGVPHDFLCYCVDFVGEIANSLPVKVNAMQRHSRQYGTVNSLFGEVHYENDVVALVNSTKRSVFFQQAQVHGTDAILTVPLAFTNWHNPPLDLVVEKKFGFPEQKSIQVDDGYGPDADLKRVGVYRSQLIRITKFLEEEGEDRGDGLARSCVGVAVKDALLRSAELGRAEDVQIPGRVASEYMVGRR
jgi:xylose dehydrogenase (NAD/NADP)